MLTTITTLASTTSIQQWHTALAQHTHNPGVYAVSLSLALVLFLICHPSWPYHPWSHHLSPFTTDDTEVFLKSTPIQPAASTRLNACLDDNITWTTESFLLANSSKTEILLVDTAPSNPLSHNLPLHRWLLHHPVICCYKPLHTNLTSLCPLDRDTECDGVFF